MDDQTTPYPSLNNTYLAEQLNDEMKRAVMPVTVFVGVEVVLGFFGNLIVLYVFMFRYHACNFRYFVLCLAFIDITSSLTTMPGEIVTQLYWYVYPLPMVCKIKSFFNMFTVSAETLCLLTIAVDRYRKVCRPHGWQIKHMHAKILCVGIYVSGFAMGLPVGIFWGTHTETELFKETNVTVTVCEKDQDFEDSKRPLHLIITLEIIICISLLCMLIIYILIARKLICLKTDNANNSGKMEGGANEQSHVTITREESFSETNDEVEDPGEMMHNVSSATTGVTVQSSEQGARFTAGATFTCEDAETNGTTHTIVRKTYMTKVRRKTLIMFILTVTFIVTTIIYLTLLSLIANDILRQLSDTERAVYFFFFRLVFINHVINPMVYGALDPTFRKTITTWKKPLRSSTTSSLGTTT